MSGRPPPLHASRILPPPAEEDFGTAAGRLAGFCGLHFGWAPAQFWVATPAEVGAMVAALVPQQVAPVTRGELTRLEGGDG